MTRTIYYDLTEAMLSNSGKRTQYYGIARVVHEIAKEAVLLREDIRFVVFSFGKQAFYEVNWHRTTDGGVEFDLPRNTNQKWIRSYFGNNRLLPAVFRLVNARTLIRNARDWDDKAAGLRPVEIKQGLFISAARPKLIVDMVRVLRQQGSNVGIVPLLHDFMPLHDGATKRFRRIDTSFLNDNRYLISNSVLILTNSNFTKKELEDFSERGVLPRPTAPVISVPLVHHCPEGTEPPEIALPEQPYILTVGLNLGRKNIEVVLEALRLIASEGGSPPHLVIAGVHRKRVRRYVERRQFQQIRDKVLFIDNPNQTDLVRLYKGALALVMPSKLEGWGLPAGEALWFGTPVISSSVDALKEVCGDVAEYFEPDNASELAKAIHRLTSDHSLYQNIKDRIHQLQPSFRTWKTVAYEIQRSVLTQ